METEEPTLTLGANPTPVEPPPLKTLSPELLPKQQQCLFVGPLAYQAWALLFGFLSWLCLPGLWLQGPGDYMIWLYDLAQPVAQAPEGFSSPCPCLVPLSGVPVY